MTDAATIEVRAMFRRATFSHALVLFAVFGFVDCAHAWDADGHHAVGAIADKLIEGTNAAKQVHVILGSLSLQDAAVWADCAKGVNPKTGYKYEGAGKFPECSIFETPAEEVAMEDFVKRNDTSCNRKPTEDSCHKQYHYSDIAVEHNHYDAGYVGARNDDIVHALLAVTHVLNGDPAPAPFNIKDKREALLLLAHYVGDIHQPLHVGAVYLTMKGKRTDPDIETFNPATETRGGNDIIVVTAKKKGANLHAMWDAIITLQNASHLSATRLNEARAVPLTAGSLFDWPEKWASATQKQAQLAFKGLAFTPKQGSHWMVTLPAKYSTAMNATKRQQLNEAGARLAEMLEAIWP